MVCEDNVCKTWALFKLSEMFQLRIACSQFFNKISLQRTCVSITIITCVEYETILCVECAACACKPHFGFSLFFKASACFSSGLAGLAPRLNKAHQRETKLNTHHQFENQHLSISRVSVNDIWLSLSFAWWALHMAQKALGGQAWLCASRHDAMPHTTQNVCCIPAWAHVGLNTNCHSKIRSPQSEGSSTVPTEETSNLFTLPYTITI